MISIAILIVVFFVFLFLGMPIGTALGISSIASLVSADLPGILLPQRTFVQLDSFSLMAVPVFILAGEVMASAGITQKIVKFASSIVGHFTAGLAQTSILGAMLMAGISGSAAADASALGGMLIPAMKDEGYDEDFAAAIVASSNVIGPIIPPSIMMIIYGSMTGVSIGAMFIGGVIPGICFGMALMVITYIFTRKRNIVKKRRATLGEIWQAFKEAFWSMLTPIIIIGGILSGFFTPTESGIVAVVYAFIVGFASKTIKLKDVKTIVMRAAMGTTTPMFLIGISSVFGWILARNNFPVMAGEFLSSITSSPYIFMVIIWAFYLFIGCFMEDTAAMIILTPVLAPIAATYGIDPVHFGVFTVVTLLIGCITPPVGMLLFITSSIAKIKLTAIYRAIIPFTVTLALIALVLGLVPQMVTLLAGMI